jgi:hypothetical protein
MEKRMRVNGLVLVALAMACVLAGCGPTTNLTGMWEEPGLEKAVFKKVLIIGLSNEEGKRRAFESEMQKQFEAKGVAAISSVAHMPLDVEMNEETLKKYFGDMGIDAVLVSRVVGVEQKVEYTPGYTYAVPAGYYNGFYGYYNTSWGMVSSPGYMSTYEVANAETNLYRVSDAKLVWSGVSETFDHADALDGIRSFSAAVVPQLVKKGWFASSK